MCGIAGEFSADPRAAIAAAAITAMARALAHRGPDGEGVRIGPGYGLGHRRLSIVDVAGGAQPMSDGTDQLWITFNGEIYNFPELRAELQALGHVFRTNSDTEVLLHGWRAFGERLPDRLNGMFAFALVDQRTHTLFAARDPLGKKPFHYTRVGDRLLFASELKALRTRPDVRAAVEPRALARYLCLRYVPDPDTIFAGIHKLPPGHWLRFQSGELTVQRYFRVSFATQALRSEAELEQQILGLLDDAVRIRLMGEVPLGAFLSGGVDSSAVVDSMRRSSSGKVIACGIGFEDPRYDERPYARQVAAAVGAQLYEGVVTLDDMLDQQWFADTFDEPFSDSSAIPTYWVSKLARQHVTVALSGDGGDECFAGYRRYRFDVIENRWRRCLPQGVFAALGQVYPKFDYLPRWLRFKRTLQNLARNPAEAYARSVSANLPETVLGLLRPEWAVDHDPLRPIREAYLAADGDDPLARAMAADLATWLPGDILTKVDRASMAVSLEVRAPFLDRRMVQLAAGIPSAVKRRGHATKGLLRRVLRQRLGAECVTRRKQGFSVPLRRWLAQGLGDELTAALRADRLGTFVRVDVVQGMLDAHRRGVSDQSELLWALLVLDRFLARWAS